MQPKRTDWLSVHRDDQLSAASPLTGRLGEPREQWRVFLGGRIRVAETVESLTTPGHLDLLIIDRGGIHRVTADGATVWRSRALDAIGGASAQQDAINARAVLTNYT